MLPSDAVMETMVEAVEEAIVEVEAVVETVVMTVEGLIKVKKIILKSVSTVPALSQITALISAWSLFWIEWMEQ